MFTTIDMHRDQAFLDRRVSDTDNRLIRGLNGDEKFAREFRRQRVRRKVNKGEVLFLEGDRAAFYYIVLSGRIRLYKCDDSMKEVTIYKVHPGQGCMLSAFTIQNGTTYPVNAVADSDTVLICISAEVFRDWIEKYDTWRSYVFELMSGNLASILYNLETIAFKRLDQQIARLLLRNLLPNQEFVQMTHSDIARELGTAREVVSRALKQLERAELIRLFRGRIQIFDPNDLQTY